MLPVWGFRATGAVAEPDSPATDRVASGIQTTIGLLIAAGLGRAAGLAAREGPGQSPVLRGGGDAF